VIIVNLLRLRKKKGLLLCGRVIRMMQVREIQVNNEGKIIGLKGIFNKDKHFKYNSTKVYMWSLYGLDYIGG
jgi:hypothetical protein